MLTKEWLALTKERFTHIKSSYDFLFSFLSYTRLNLTNLLINLLGLSRLNLGLFLCEGCERDLGALEDYINDFSLKHFPLEQMSHFEPKNGMSLDYFCTMRGAKRQMRII